MSWSNKTPHYFKIGTLGFSFIGGCSFLPTILDYYKKSISLFILLESGLKEDVQNSE